jgi:hypothetical protein
MRAVDVDALARYRDALARQVHQADAHGHSSYSEPRTHPAVSPARQRLSSSHTRSPTYFSSTPQPARPEADSMWGTLSTNSFVNATPSRGRRPDAGQGTDKLATLMESIRQFEVRLNSEEHRFLCPPSFPRVPFSLPPLMLPLF